jgi:hypothetical protein
MNRRRSMRYRYPALAVIGVVAVLALVGRLSQPRTSGAEHGGAQPSAQGAGHGNRGPERGPTVQPEMTATRATDANADCGSGYRAIGSGLCEPLQADGHPYRSEQLAKYRAMLQSRLVSKANFLVPRLMPIDELQNHRQLIERMTTLSNRIQAHHASEDDINEYFNFRERVTSYRLQVLRYARARGGGATSEKEDADEFDLEQSGDALLRDYHQQIVSRGHADYLARKKARIENGLPEEDHVDWPGARL